GPARGRRDEDVDDLQARQLLPVRLVVANHDRLVAVPLRQQLEEVVGERVVIVDQQGLHGWIRDPCGLAHTRYLRRTFPSGLLGISSRYSTICGTLKLASRSRQKAINSRLSQSSLETATAFTSSSPSTLPGTPSTIASSMLGCASRTSCPSIGSTL